MTAETDAAAPQPRPVRQALPEDAEALNKLMRRLQYQTPYLLPTVSELKSAEEQARELAMLQAENWRRIFVAVGDDDGSEAFLGFLSLSRRPAHKVRHVAHCAMAILQQHRRRGWGRALLQAGEAWARHSGVRRLELTVVADNAAAIALYRQLGFVEEGRKRDSFVCAGDPQDELMMAKVWV